MKEATAMQAAPMPEAPQDQGRVPILNDVLVPARSRSGRTLWLASEDLRVPLLDDVVPSPAGRPHE